MVRGLRLTALLVGSLLPGCRALRAAGDAPAIEADEYRLPPRATMGAHVAYRWTVADGQSQPDDLVEQTVACVASDDATVTVEWRNTIASGDTTVTSVKYLRTGEIIGAWRGQPGGVGRTASVTTGSQRSIADARADLAHFLRETGVPQPNSERSREVEDILTPAGPFRCVRLQTRLSLLGTEGTSTEWRSVDRLPLNSLVRYECALPDGGRWEVLLIEVGSKGATALLAIR